MRIFYRLAAVAMLAAWSAMPAQAQTEVRFGVQPAMQPIFIAKSMGLIAEIEKKHKAKFTWPNFAYGAPQNQAFAAGELDLSTAGMGPAVIAAARLQGHLIAIDVLEQTAIIVPSASKVATMRDLKGKTVAFPGEGSQQYPLLLKALADAGMSSSDVKLFKANGPNIGQLVSQGDVDAGIIWDPHVSNALASGRSKVLLKAEKIMPIKQNHYVGNGTYVRTAFMEKNPAIVQDVVTAIVRAIDLIVAEPDKAAKMWSAEIGFPLETITYSLREGISVFHRDVVPEQATLEAYTKFLKDAGILEKSDAPKIEPKFARQALNEVKG